MSKKSLHWRNDSGELDVFEAAKYFADANEISSFAHRTHYEPWRGGRKSLDMAISFRKSSLILPPEMEKPRASSNIIKENNLNNKKHKQPSSPGGRLASFLNSLFNQTKKKSKSKSGKDDEDESPGGVRRRRRSSISHFYSIRSSSTNTSATANNPTMAPNNKFLSSSGSGFRTPPPCAYTPTKSYKDFAIFSDQQVINGLKNHNKVIAASLQSKDHEPHGEKPNGVSQKYKLMSTKNHSNGDSRYPPEETEKRKFNGEDDDADSDTSSDLFDLPNSELLMDFYSSSGLPVYETTKMESIKRSAPISTAAI